MARKPKSTQPPQTADQTIPPVETTGEASASPSSTPEIKTVKPKNVVTFRDGSRMETF